MRVSTDLFTLNSRREYVILVNYYSKFMEVAHLFDTESKSVIKAIKTSFVTHGIPKLLFSDNGPQ